MDTCESGAQYKTGYQERDRIVLEPKTFWIEPKTSWRWRSDSWVIGDNFRECGLMWIVWQRYRDPFSGKNLY